MQPIYKIWKKTDYNDVRETCRGGHFYGLLAYRSTEKKTVFKLKREFDGSNPYMKFGSNPIKYD